MALQAIRTDRPEQWLAALARSGNHDFYHRADYHVLAEQRGEGDAVLLNWTGTSASVALPLLLRPIGMIPGLEQVGAGLADATSVYGYAGPVGPQVPLPPAEATQFGSQVQQWLGSNRVISLFSRLHPLLGNAVLVAGLGEAPLAGPTVSIDLTHPAEKQAAGYRSNHRRDLNKLRSAGFTCQIASDAHEIGTFAEIYLQTMERVAAAPSYAFDASYFEQLLAIPGLELMLCTLEGEVCAGAVLSTYGAIAQYHLGGTADRWLKSAPMKLIFDEARTWACEMGCTRLHLGGGLGAREDALFNFKAGFSADRHEFRVWRWVIDQATHDRLAAQSAAAASDPERFPAYRP